VSAQGGFFTGRPRVQVKQNGSWVEVGAQTVSPAYPGDVTCGANTTYTITFPVQESDGVRVIGLPGGTRSFTSVAELAVKYAAQLADGGFEATGGGKPPWLFEGTAPTVWIEVSASRTPLRTTTGSAAPAQVGVALYQTSPSPRRHLHLRSLANASANRPADQGRFGVHLGTQDLGS
jgi:hypothetical protein